MSNTIQKINQPRDPSRREMLKRVGAAGAIGATVAVPVAQVTQQAHAQSNSGNLREALEVLTAAESDVLEAMVARIVPTDNNGPGAAEARAAHYIDRALTGPLAGSKAAYVSGLAALDDYAKSSKGALFTKLGAADQDAVLSGASNSHHDGDRSRETQCARAGNDQHRYACGHGLTCWVPSGQPPSERRGRNCDD
mgnify:CR=1 FL=1